MNNLNIGANLRFYREKAGFTQQEVADKLCVAKATIGHWENNKRTARHFIIEKLAKLYETTTTNILGTENISYDTEENALLDKIILDFYDESILDKDAEIDDLDDIHKQMLHLAVRDYIKKLLVDK